MSKWIHKTSQDHLAILDFVNALHPDPNGIQGAMSGEDYHVWVKEGSNKQHKYVLQIDGWDGDSPNIMEQLMESKTVCVLGLYINEIYYLEGA